MHRSPRSQTDHFNGKESYSYIKPRPTSIVSSTSSAEECAAQELDRNEPVHARHPEGECGIPVRVDHEGVAKARGQSLAQMALQWVLRLPVVTSALIGASSVVQLEQNLDALGGAPLSAEELARIEAVLG